MSSKLAVSVDQSYGEPSSYEKFFSREEKNKLAGLFKDREAPGDAMSPCDTNLFIGVFFDGTGNNYADSIDKQDHSQSNIARLYSAYPGLSVPGVLPPETNWQTNLSDYDNFFRIYTAGVGTPFEPVGDSGKGFWDATLGGGAGRLGQVRILWGLAQVINALSRYFLKQPLIDNAEVQQASAVGRMSSTALHSKPLSHVAPGDRIAARLPQTLVGWLRRLHNAIRPHMTLEGSRPRNIDPGIVRNIYLSAFGFSRGAALSRVFANWLVRLCQWDAKLTNQNGLTLAGFPVTFDFLGLFDTVASVGIANLVPVSDGHAAWADAEVSLAIPPEVARCVHLVSAHENRRSFPLDSIYNDHSIANNGDEIVFPGVHSDIGGGYRPGDQGKGVDNIGRDLLARIPLAVVYREARLSGVPFKLEQALDDVKDGFKITPETLEAFNRYIETFDVVSGETGKIVREHWRRAVEWRLNNHRAGGVSTLNSYQRASQYDRNNLSSGYAQFCEELERFAQWEAWVAKGDWERAFESVRDFMVMGSGWYFYDMAEERGLDPSLIDDWQRIADIKDQFGPSPQAISHLMDEYVHDSIAGFLPEWDSRDEVITYLRTLVAKKHVIDTADLESRRGITLSDEERERAAYFERTGRIPPMDELGGRESFLLGGGYLRFRRIYAGADDQLLTLLAPKYRPGAQGPGYASHEVGASSGSARV
ncbi:T6SS phospholipase effector Tle1-like catalytic domain-containing protein [Chromohalobacter israelensis]|uniref:T6SS phospholipase effector Tle1-like catalytic domain-containing protein n=1 Tax=Chromohalobacter israelensis TaxID=141390 RepID=UPI0015C4C6A0|nr:DUF2235 domain-containing protein [Chromohalobacter salexigens]NWO55502.1 hypothetical protein [Chromohalobacter salexigens]